MSNNKDNFKLQAKSNEQVIVLNINNDKVVATYNVVQHLVNVKLLGDPQWIRLVKKGFIQSHWGEAHALAKSFIEPKPAKPTTGEQSNSSADSIESQADSNSKEGGNK